MAKLSLIKPRAIAQLYRIARSMSTIDREHASKPAAFNKPINSAIKINIPSSSFKELNNVPSAIIRAKNLTKLAADYLLSGEPLHKNIGPAAVEQKSAHLIRLEQTRTLADKLGYLRALQDQGAPFTMDLLDHVILVASEQPCPDLVRDLVREIGLSGAGPTEFHYLCLCRAHEKAGDADGVRAVIDSLRANAQPVRPALYCVLMSLQLRQNDAEGALATYRKMRFEGAPETEESLVAFARVCRKLRNPLMACSAMEQYENTGGVVTRDVLNAVIGACSNSKSIINSGISKAFQLFKRMCTEKMVPNTKTYNNLIAVATNASDINLGIKVVRLMEQNNVAKSFYTYRNMVRCIAATMKSNVLVIEGVECTRNDRIDMAFRLIKELEAQGAIKIHANLRQKIQIDLFGVLNRAGALNRCIDFAKMENLDRDKDYVQIIMGHGLRTEIRCKRPAGVLFYMRQLKSLEYTPIELNRLIIVLGCRGKPEIAREVIAEMTRLKLKLNNNDIGFIKREMSPGTHLVYKKHLGDEVTRIARSLSLGDGKIKMPKRPVDRNRLLRQHGLLAATGKRKETRH